MTRLRLAFAACATAVMMSAPLAAGAQPARIGRLAPPPPAECTALQRRLAAALPRPLTAAPGPVEFFSGDFRLEGRGCVLTARGTGVQFDRRPNSYDAIQARLRADGWRLDERMIADGPGSQVIGFRRPGRFLSLAYEDDDGGICGDGDRAGVDCERSRARSRVTVTIGLARGAP